jgi:hypothetical protein
MRHRYEPDDGLYRDFPTRHDEPLAATRDDGLRRLSRLTWRGTQLSALAAAGFAILFARTAPIHAASNQAPVQPARAQSAATGTATPSPASRTGQVVRTGPSVDATPTARPSATTPAPQPSSAPAAPAAAASTPPPTLAPPTTPPAPAPAPSPVQSTSSGSHSS